MLKFIFQKFSNYFNAYLDVLIVSKVTFDVYLKCFSCKLAKNLQSAINFKHQTFAFVPFKNLKKNPFQTKNTYTFTNT